jgi:hypothetical protein
MDGTLLDLRFDNFFWQELIPSRYAALHGLPHEEAVAVLTPRFEAARGTLEWYCLDHWSRELGYRRGGAQARGRGPHRFPAGRAGFPGRGAGAAQARGAGHQRASRLAGRQARSAPGWSVTWTRSTPATTSACRRRTRRFLGPAAGHRALRPGAHRCWWTTACRCCARRTPSASPGWSRSCARLDAPGVAVEAFTASRASSSCCLAGRGPTSPEGRIAPPGPSLNRLFRRRAGCLPKPACAGRRRRFFRGAVA